MILTKNILYKNFSIKNYKSHSYRKLELILKNKNEVLKSLTTEYKYSFSKSLIKKFKNFSTMRIIGMGGSILGAKAIKSFLNFKIKKKVVFVDNLLPHRNLLENNKKILNLVISKSGNTLETITNVNILIKKNQKKFL